MNLLKETKEILKENNRVFEDILWIGNNKYFVDIEEFKKIADIIYDNSYGSTQVADDLLIVGNNWWLERHEYDGSEWWEYKEIPIKPNEKVKLTALTINQAEHLGYDVSCGYETLGRINGIDDFYGNRIK